MTSSDILAYVKQIAPDLTQGDTSLLNFIDRANKRLVKKLLWPDSWVTAQTVQNQQAYISLPMLHVNAVYVAGQLCTKTDRATLEGRQIGLYSQVPSPAGFAAPAVAATGYVQVSGPITTGDVLMVVLQGVPFAYVVKNTDTTLAILATSLQAAMTADLNLSFLATFLAVGATPGQVAITGAQPGNIGAPLTLTVSKSAGATETFVASGPTLTGGSNGSDGAPGTVGPYAPAWVVAQEPLTYPVQNTWYNSIKPDAQPWGLCMTQPPRYFWHGGQVVIVPNTSTAGQTIAIDGVRQPDTITTLQQPMVSPDMFLDAIAADTIRQAYMGSADTKHITLAQMWESSYKDYEKELVLWRGTFEGDDWGLPKMLTQRVRMGINRRLRKR